MTAPSLHKAADIASLPAEARDDLRAYAELGGFTLTTDTHAWYAAVDTVAGPEEARAASTVLAELRGRDLPALRDAAHRLAEAESLGIHAPRTVAESGHAVALLLRVRLTLRTLSPDAYDVEDAELDELVAATASGAWRRERGVKVTWLRRRSLRGRVRGLATGRPRRDAVHTALASAATERTDWAALGGAGRPAVPADADFLDDASRAAEAALAGLGELGRLLGTEATLDALPFEELAELLDRLAADEGTLYRLPNLKATRDRLEEQGLGAVLAELTERRADAAEVAALLGEAETPVVPEPRPASDTTEEASEEAPEAAEAASEVAAAEAVVEVEPEAAPAEVVVEPVVEAAVEVEPEPVVAAEVVAEAAPVEAEPVVAEAAPVEAEPVVAEVSVVEEEAAAAEAVPVAEAVVEVEPEAAPAEAVVEPVVEAAVEVEPEPVVEAEVVAEAAPVEAEPVVAEVSVVEEEAAAAEAVPVAEAVVEVEPEAAPAEALVEPVVEAAVEVEPEPVVEAEVVAEAAPVEAEPVVVEAPVAEEEAPAATEPEAPVEVEPEPVAEAAAGRGEKPSITPGKAVTAYSAAELTALVRWIDGDGEKRSDDELLRAAMKELGFARLGPRIKEALGAAVAEARA